MAEENGWEPTKDAPEAVKAVARVLVDGPPAYRAKAEEAVRAAVKASGGALGPRVEEYRAVIADLIANEPEPEEGSPRWYAFRNARALLAGESVSLRVEEQTALTPEEAWALKQRLGPASNPGSGLYADALRKVEALAALAASSVQGEG